MMVSVFRKRKLTVDPLIKIKEEYAVAIFMGRCDIFQ